MIRLLTAEKLAPALTVADQAIVAGSNFLILVLLGRNLSSEGFGAYVVSLALLNVLLGVHGASVTVPLSIYATAEGSEETMPYIRGSGRLHLAQVCVIAAFAGLVGLLLPPGSMWRTICLVFAALQIPYQLNDYIRRLLLTRHKTGALLRHDGVSSALKIAGVLAVVTSEDATLWRACLAIVVGLLVGAVLHRMIDGRELWCTPREGIAQSPLQVARRNWSLTRLMLPEVLSYHATTQAFILISASLLTEVEVAALGGIQAVANVVNVFLAGLTNYGLVDLTRSRHRNDMASWRSSALVMSVTAMALTGLCSVALSVFPTLLLSSIYGSTSYILPYAGVLRIFGLVILARTMSVLLITVLRSMEFQAPITAATLTAGCLSAAAAGPTMLAFGLPGAAYGLLAGQTILASVLSFGAWRQFRSKDHASGASNSTTTGP